jgi:hydroxyacylglutathione hydrolase
VYLLGDVLVDAGGRGSARKILQALAGRAVVAHVLTHAHFDHQGSSHAVCTQLGVPLWCGEGDRRAMESGDPAEILPNPRGWAGWLHRRLAGPAHPVSRVLHDGDAVGGFTVVEAPGHTPGHLAFWRERDGVLVLGDVAFHRNPLSLRLALQEPFRFATRDPQRNRESARGLAALRPGVICFGHGPPLLDGERFARFVARLPSA